MSSRNVLAAAYLFDWIAGDPEWFPHPVRVIGRGIEKGERTLRRTGQTSATELVSGGVLTVGLVLGAYLGTATVTNWIKRRNRRLGIAAETMLAWTCLASRSLHDEASAVVEALEIGELVIARQRLARIVGRDTQELDEQEISRALIETVAESSSDGIIAPLFYMAIGGVPLAMAYKAINTLDSMIGHADDRYFYFGKIAARLDDVANFLPSRLTALGIAAVALVENADAKAALETWRHDGMKHKSPNAGQPESAMAGALQVRLGVDNYYSGELVTTPLIGANFAQPDVQKARRAIQMVAAVSVVGALASLLLCRGRR
jgi:adenosylcobinamide-phosphate synthase